jgi:hypothetical protein
MTREQQRFSRAARWLGTRLADGNDFASALLRAGAELGFSEAVVRAAFGEIGANVHSGVWELAPAARQLWANWAVARGVPALGDREAYAAFWKAPPAAAQRPLPTPGMGLGPEFVEQSARTREQYRQFVEERDRAKPRTTGGTIDTAAAIYARRRDAGRS